MCATYSYNQRCDRAIIFESLIKSSHKLFEWEISLRVIYNFIESIQGRDMTWLSRGTLESLKLSINFKLFFCRLGAMSSKI